RVRDRGRLKDTRALLCHGVRPKTAVAPALPGRWWPLRIPRPRRDRRANRPAGPRGPGLGWTASSDAGRDAARFRPALRVSNRSLCRSGRRRFLWTGRGSQWRLLPGASSRCCCPASERVASIASTAAPARLGRDLWNSPSNQRNPRAEPKDDRGQLTAGELRPERPLVVIDYSRVLPELAERE